MEVPNATYRLIGGDPALDLANTASWYPAGTVRGREPLDRIGKERLVVGDDVTRWGVAAGILPKGALPGEPSVATLTRTRRLRLAIYHIFRASIQEWRPDAADVAVLDAEAREARSAERLVLKGDGWRWEWRDDPTPEERVFRVVAVAAVSLLTSERGQDVKQCAGDECGWLFLDTSRNHKRRWCEMADCGNLAKVRRFRGQSRPRSRPR